MRFKTILIALLLLISLEGFSKSPVRVGVAGLSHSHVISLLRNSEHTNIEIVGIAEKDRQLSQRYAERFGLDTSIIFESLEEMLAATKPQGVLTYTSIYEHLEVVEACAPRGIHVMVEKPLAVSVEHAKRMVDLAEKHKTLLLTNYETTWYPSIHEVSKRIKNGEVGALRKVIVYDGHTGPQEIGVNDEFLEWLTDPRLNGGGAVTDFGCYGANIVTWMMGGARPTSVSAHLKQYKPETYPKVDDDATIILTYPDMEALILASWNWPFSRKDMHLYGETGYLFQDDPTQIRYRYSKAESEQMVEATYDQLAFKDPFSFFAAAIRKEIEISKDDLSSATNNLLVVEILEAARESARIGKVILLPDH